MVVKRSALILILMTCCGLTLAAKAPTFQLKDLDGKLFKLEDQTGKIVVLSFWASYCKPCRKELPELAKIHQELKDKGLVFYSINTDKAAATSQVRALVQQYQYQFPVLLDVDSSTLEKYNSDRTLPFMAIIDGEGNLARTHSGYKPGDEATVRTEIEELLSKLCKTTAKGSAP